VKKPSGFTIPRALTFPFYQSLQQYDHKSFYFFYLFLSARTAGPAFYAGHRGKGFFAVKKKAGGIAPACPRIKTVS
jgi:hypothetical protein